ncbi:DUF2188 domain-containing protein [Paeniglutamicibacter gangotriensis]|uniref:DUF2188 domain-containing protein n=1 Tax=Paeniglutamicibacter gangotriensis TaxID=254787 RepID=A0A5B0EP17_9MICC|nr:DUF2188 domain-containing protein [Paeniglutamicibacter gangotriensis]KAA0979895.1 DUF2188 domain-containing protein [Paeniglutamicibacter gangotriensis]
MTTEYNVFKTDAGWATKRQGAQRAASISPTQAQAYEAAKGFVSNAGGGEVSVHGVNGKIRDKNTIKPAVDPKKTEG